MQLRFSGEKRKTLQNKTKTSCSIGELNSHLQLNAEFLSDFLSPLRQIICDHAHYSHSTRLVKVRDNHEELFIAANCLKLLRCWGAGGKIDRSTRLSKFLHTKVSAKWRTKVVQVKILRVKKYKSAKLFILRGLSILQLICKLLTVSTIL